MIRASSLRTLLAVLLPLFFVVSACDSGGSGGGVIDNEFSFEIEPASSSNAEAASVEAAQDEVNGFSFFVDSEDVEGANTDERTFAVYFAESESLSPNSASEGLFGFLARNSGQPGEGTFDLVDTGGEPASSEFAGVLWKDIANQQSAPFYVFKSGSVTISESSDDKISGKITGQATEFEFTSTGVNEQDVKITGNFTARNSDIWLPLSNPSTP